MKVLFSIPGSKYRVADRKRKIIDTYDGKYYDIKGNIVLEEESFKQGYHLGSVVDTAPNKLKIAGTSEILIPESVTEIEYEIDDLFGTFGYKNEEGSFAIEPQYAYAHEFTWGLAAVNLNRTWYRSEEGKRWYENHYGYIDERGKTVIPFIYDEARPFNKYGVAVVGDLEKRYLIDTSGSVIPNTETLDFSGYYDYDDRFFEFEYYREEYDDYNQVGIYDTKYQKVILEPSIDSIIQWKEDLILVYEAPDADNEFREVDFRQRYINGEGESLFPWLEGKGFSIVEPPNDSMMSVVAVSRFTTANNIESGYFKVNGKKYERKWLYGIYSSAEEYILPTEYDAITDLSDNTFVCLKDGVISVIEV